MYCIPILLNKIFILLNIFEERHVIIGQINKPSEINV